MLKNGPQSGSSRHEIASVDQDRESPAAVARAGRAKYNGFIGGMFSGVAKLGVGYPFDTVKVRLQTAPRSQFNGPVDCLVQTLRNEGARGLYKGVTPPLVGWMFMDSLMLGSLTYYRSQLHIYLYPSLPVLPTSGHSLAGLCAGITVSFIAVPIEHVKARLQTQYSASKSQRAWSGPIDCVRSIYTTHGVRGLYRGLSATLLFRSNFVAWWGSYDVFSRALRKPRSEGGRFELSAPATNFWAGGLSAQVFWCVAYPADIVKNRIMCSPLGPATRVGHFAERGQRVLLAPRAYPTWWDAARSVYTEGGAGWRGFWRGFTPCFLRAFPANATALLVFEGVLRTLA